MTRLLVLACAVSLASMSAAHAQATKREIPADLRAAGEAVIQYVRALPEHAFTMLYETNGKLNNPTEQVLKWIADDRATVARAADELAALKKPVSKVQGFDVSMLLERMSLDTKARIATTSAGLNALDAMMAAQKTGDCTAYVNHAAAFKKTEQELPAFSTWRDAEEMETFIVRFTGATPVKGPAKVSMAPATNASRMRQLAADLAAPLHCPLPHAAFDIEVSIAFLANVRDSDNLFADVHVTSGLDASQRAEIEQRFLNFPVPDTRRFTNWTDAKQPLKFRWDGQVLAPLIE